MTDKQTEILKLALEVFSIIAIADNLDWIKYQAEQQAKAIREALAQDALDKMAENARELGLDYEVAEESSGTEQPAQQQEPVRHWSDCATNNRGCPELLGTCDCGGIPPKPEPIAWLLEFVDEDGLSRRDVFYEQQHLQWHVKHNTALRGLTCKVEPLYASSPTLSQAQRQSRSDVKPLMDETRDTIVRQAAENDWHDYQVIDAVEAVHGITKENT